MNFDNWLIEQQSNCALATANLVGDFAGTMPLASAGNVTYLGLNANMPRFLLETYYLSGPKLLNNLRYADVVLKPL